MRSLNFSFVRRWRGLFPCCGVVLTTLLLCSLARADDSLSKLKPFFKQHCFDCHGAAKEKKGKLDLRLQRFLVRGGETGPAIVPGKPAESFLLQRLQAGVKRLQRSGGDPSKIVDLMEQFAPLVRQQKFREAEAILDEALKLLK